MTFFLFLVLGLPPTPHPDGAGVIARGAKTSGSSFEHRSAIAPAPPGATAAATTTLERHLTLMGTEARLVLTAANRPAALAASERAYRALAATANRLSTWTADSELAHLNAVPPGRPIGLSPELCAELAAAFACRTLTAGAFDPEVGRLVTAWGLRRGGRIPAVSEIDQLAAAARGPGLALDPDTRQAVRHGERTVEEGAWGKGAALDRALAALGPGVSAQLDLGGQLLLSADLEQTVAVADPRERGRALVELDVRGGSLSTSGNGERGLVMAGRRIGHLLDPRTGRPAPDFGSVTVWAETALEADCLSTGLYVLGPDAALAFAATHPGVEVVVIESRAAGGPRVRASAGFAGRVRALHSNLDLAISQAPERPAAHHEEGVGTAAPEAIGPDPWNEP